MTDMSYPLNTSPLISAHRGGKYIDDYPENCLETFRYVTSTCPLIIECDVAATADGELVLMHDKTIDRTTNGSGPISSLTMADLNKLSLLDHLGNTTRYRIPKLEDVLTWAKGNAILSLDIKGSIDRKELLTQLRKHRAHEYAIIITYDVESAAYYQQEAPEYTLSANIRNFDELRRYQDANFDLSKLQAFVGTRRKETFFYEKLHSEGLLTIHGTMGNLDKQAQATGPKLYDRILDQGADIFATDYPLDLVQYYYCGKPLLER